MLVGLSGYARAGKDTGALALAKDGYQRIAFADIMRDFLYRLDPVVGKKREPGSLGPRLVRLQEVIDDLTWDGYKQSEHYGMEIRQLMQRLGTECGRELLGENIWVDSALKDVQPDQNYVVTDCRFLNEADAIRNRGGKVIRITRPGIGPANSHASETSLDHYDFDAVVLNNSTPEALAGRLLEAIYG